MPELPPELWSLADDYFAVFTTEAGKRVLGHLALNACMAVGVQSTTGDTWTPEGQWQPVATIDPLRMAVNEGKRQLYELIRTMMALSRTPDRRVLESGQSESPDPFRDDLRKENAP